MDSASNNAFIKKSGIQNHFPIKVYKTSGTFNPPQLPRIRPVHRRIRLLVVERLEVDIARRGQRVQLPPDARERVLRRAVDVDRAPARLRRDAERRRQFRRDQRLRQRRQVLGARQPHLPLHNSLIAISHTRFFVHLQRFSSITNIRFQQQHLRPLFSDDPPQLLLFRIRSERKMRGV